MNRGGLIPRQAWLLIVVGIAVLATALLTARTIIRSDAEADLAAEMRAQCTALGRTAQVEPIEGEWYAGCELWHNDTGEPDAQRMRQVEQGLLANGWAQTRRDDDGVVYHRRTGLWDSRAHMISRPGEGFAFSFHFAD